MGPSNTPSRERTSETRTQKQPEGGGFVRNDKTSIKYKCTPLEGAQINSDGYAPPPSEISKENGSILTTKELVSAIAHVWDSASDPLSALLNKSSSRFNRKDSQNREILTYQTGETSSITGISSDETIAYCISSCPDSASIISENLQHVRAIQKKYLLDRSKRHYSDFGRFLGLGYIGVPDDLRNVYGWMKIYNKSKNFVVPVETKNVGHVKTPTCTNKDVDDVVYLTNSGNTANIGNVDDALDKVDLAIVQEVNPVITSLVSSATIRGKDDVSDLQCTGSNTSIQRMRSQKDYNLPISAYCGSVSEGTKCKIENVDVLSDEIYQPMKARNNHVQSEFSVSSREKSHNAIAEKKHAVAGAMAGVSVSLCLHPVDTVKTVVQSCRANQNSLHQIGKSIISERGVCGLYRGISSNIASSAPISAIYTFTYESVKSSLLPLFPKEYQSLAHCMAGGSASVATSFVFTPSERIKQQMQISSHYQNCWNALIKIIEKGGFSSLYAGWRAVLCRNVPHSIIKFYTYESLKQLIFPPGQLSDGVQTNTLLTLICGGLSGSTAALFTTPFDVVKTRLQTQIPGSKSHYDGVLYTLKHIGENEGMKGLYRGLTPRLFMYMTQGALFFTSYESFKRLISSDMASV